MSSVKQLLSGEYGEEACMTVGDLIRELLVLPQDYVISTEGCDCYGNVTEVTIDEAGKRIYLNRKPEQIDVSR